ncbi:MAG: 50S ribosomal protein L11 methyltransferase [Pseudomonadota bacterium]
MPETFTALTTLADATAAAALGEALERLEPAPTGVGVFEIDETAGLWEVGGYFTARPDEVGLAVLAASHGARPFAVSRLADRDWVAEVRRELTPVRAGRFLVYGSHDRESIPSHLVGLEIEAAMAFGTGHHATTQGCLLAYDRLLRRRGPPRRVADIGAGTGVLAMAAVRTGAGVAIASDIDATAAATARANARANQAGPRIRAVRAPGFRHGVLREAAPYDLIFANILAGPLRRLAPEMARHSAPGGQVILSGILDRQAAAVLATYRGWGFRVLARDRLGGWTTLTLTRLARA